MASINLQGDTSGSITISAPAVAGTTTLELPTTSSTLATENALGVRNLVINGDMRIDQRNGGSSVTPSNNDYCLDRYGTGLAQASKYSVQQVTDAPTDFTHSLKVTSLSAYTLLAGDYFMIKHKIEGNNVAHLNLGSSDAKEFTLSFYVKSSLTGTFGGSFENSNESRAYPFTYTISSANTWERVSVTVTGDTTGTWQTNNSTGLWINFGLGVGTTYSGTADAWTTGPKVSATGATSVVSTNSATWQITGVQLEVGNTATEFEHRPYDMELARCQRYYYKSYGQDTGAVPVTSSGWLGSRIGIAYATSYVTGDWRYPVTMRANPTLSIYHQDGTANAIYEIDTGAKKTITATNYGNDSGFWRITSSSAFTANKHYYFQLVAVAEL